MHTRPWARRARRTGLLTVVLLAVLAEPALAAVSVVRAEVSGTRLRLEGTALAGRSITVDSVPMATSDGSGAFRIERDPYAPPADCTVDVNDGSATITTTRLAGCTVTVVPTPGDSTAPSAPVLSVVLSGSTANLSWPASTDDVGVVGYTVSRTGVPPVDTASTSYASTGLAPGRTRRAPDGRGVRGMRQRVQLLGGVIDIGLTRHGWSVHAEVPLGESGATRNPGRGGC